MGLNGKILMKSLGEEKNVPGKVRKLPGITEYMIALNKAFCRIENCKQL